MSKIKPLKTGDTLPDIEFDNLFNYKSDKIRLADFKGKLIILDFWSFSCLACIESFEKLDSFQKTFADKIQFILINKQSKDSTERFFARRKKIKIPDLPFITNDVILKKWFPHTGVPFHVWIDGNGIVRHLTRGYNTNHKNISQFLDGNHFTGKEYKKVEPIGTLIDKRWINSVGYFSYLARCIDGIKLYSYGKKEDQIVLISNCQSIKALYMKAFNEGGKYNFDKGNRTILEVEDTSKYIIPYNNKDNYDSWKENHSYNYHLSIPKQKAGDIYQIMRDDLQRFFDLEAGIEKRARKCLVLVKTSSDDNLKSKGGPGINNFYITGIKNPRSDSIRYFHNWPYSEFSDSFKRYIEYYFSMPFIDSTNYQGNIDLEMPADAVDALNINQLRKELNRYHLDLIEKDCLIDVLVIKEKPKTL